MAAIGRTGRNGLAKIHTEKKAEGICHDDSTPLVKAHAIDELHSLPTKKSTPITPINGTQGPSFFSPRHYLYGSGRVSMAAIDGTGRNRRAKIHTGKKTGEEICHGDSTPPVKAHTVDELHSLQTKKSASSTPINGTQGPSFFSPQHYLCGSGRVSIEAIDGTGRNGSEKIHTEKNVEEICHDDSTPPAKAHTIDELHSLQTKKSSPSIPINGTQGPSFFSSQHYLYGSRRVSMAAMGGTGRNGPAKIHTEKKAEGICHGDSTVKAHTIDELHSLQTKKLAPSTPINGTQGGYKKGFLQRNNDIEPFDDFLKPKTTALRWKRVIMNASKVGKGLSKDTKAHTLVLKHWIEAIDPRHRYGNNLHLYYKEWFKSSTSQHFFSDGKEVDLEECPRSKLDQQCVKYFGSRERENYKYVVVDGKILHNITRTALHHVSPHLKYIFVVSTSKKLYIGVKEKGIFHHSSFLAGEATLTAGRLLVEDGVIKRILPSSGHYKPTEDSLERFLSILMENGVNIDQVQIRKVNEDFWSS